MQLVLRLVLLSLVVFFVACSSNSSKEETEDKEETIKEKREPAKLEKIKQEVELKKNWSVYASKKANDKKYLRRFPAIDKGVIYTSDIKGNIFATNIETGKRIWKIDTDLPISGSLSVSDGKLFFGTYEAQLIVYDLETKKELWRQDVSSEVLAPPVSNNRIVIVQTADSKLFAFDPETGEFKWRFDHVAPVLSLRTTSAPVIYGSHVIAAFDNGQVISVALSDGSTNWQARVAQPKGRNELERIVDVDTHPRVFESMVFVASFQGNIMALNRGNGVKAWERPESIYTNLSVDTSGVYSVSENSVITARNIYSGEIIWQNDKLKYRELTETIIVDKYLGAVDFKGILHLMDKSDGRMVGRFEIRKILSSSKANIPDKRGYTDPLLVHENDLIVMNRKGTLTSYRIE